MKKMYRLLFLVCLLPLSIFAQQKTIKGKITDSKDGSPLSGVTITAGTGTAKVATATGADGGFTLTVPANTKEIIVSTIGFSDVREKINNRDIINVRMNASAKDLGEVVVVAYGTQKKVNLTGSVATLKSSEITITKNENTLNMLTGKIPGLRMTQQSAEPGAYANTFDIRGYGGAPAIVIDGVLNGGNFQRMDPNEIESISVLKDAAAAPYGFNGGNGVILITTKKGTNKNGKFDINYSFNQGIQQFLGMPQGVNAVDYMMLVNEKAREDFGTSFTGNQQLPFSYDAIEAFVQGNSVSADWIDAAFSKTSQQVQHNINISGGSDKVSAFINLGYMKQDGVFKTNSINYDRWNFRSNISAKINDRLRAQVLLSGYGDQKNQPYQDLYEIFKYAWGALPTNTLYANNNPNYLHLIPNSVNPIAAIDPSMVGYKQLSEKNIQAQGILEYDIPYIKGLKARGVYSIGYTMDDNKSFSNQYNLYSYDPTDSSYTASHVTSTGQPSALNRSFASNTSTLAQLSLNYANTFSKVHNVTALLLYEQSQSQGDNFYAQRNITIPVNYLYAASGNGQQGGSFPNGINPVQNKGLVGRVTYDYKGKYLAEFSFRNDGSNYFPPGHKFGLFPGYSVGWRISEESFFKNHISPKLISNLKIRASYAELGLSDQANKFAFVGGYAYPPVDPQDNKPLGYMINGQFVNGAAVLPNPTSDLSWYTSDITNLGLDFTILNNKIDGTIEVYRRDLNGLPNRATVTIPGTVGVSLPLENLDSRRTEGIELSLSYKSRIGHDFSLSLGGNVSYERTRNLHVTEGPQGNQYLQWKNGQTDRNTNILWGTDYAGQYTSYSQIYNSTVNNGGGNNTVLPGDYYMQDWNGDGVINNDDYHPIAVQDLPLVNFGFNVGFTYKSIDITALFAGAAGVWTEYGEQLGQPLMYSNAASAFTKFLDSWHPVDPYANAFDPNTQWVSGKYPNMAYDYSKIQNSTKGIVNASYVRLKTLEIGYSLPNSILKKVGIKNCRFYLNGYNLLTFTGLDDGVDPEHPASFPSASPDPNFPYKYPLNRTFNFGANITL